jgi:uncharacterized protein (TIGR01244 family)
MRKLMRIPALLVLGVPSLFSGCSTPEQQPPPQAASPSQHKAVVTDKVEPYACGSITRMHTFGGVYLASQPQAADFAEAKHGGVRTVVNLRHAGETPELDEAKVVGDLGMHYVTLPWQGADELTDAVFDRAREIFAHQERPMLVHCSSANRVGAVWIPYRVLDGGLDLEAAVAEARTIGLKTAEFEQRARDYVARKR